ncbi:hypothetical protein VFPPC_17694 [Pochonia chlamydosporia 170]|uniref:Uncharacterized protein n=1 Tax=Pochonia chlamydosporia 170 TaxID=1380566 RepID=A0A219AQT5_METCM|nr:hypothetical protein VFPPC_17694 [Pochonia chlamydosporia 170]OWT43130.1 hypothetical protein VFPPC_17694 [Pochonia chlamydosporia 170]
MRFRVNLDYYWNTGALIVFFERTSRVLVHKCGQRLKPKDTRMFYLQVILHWDRNSCSCLRLAYNQLSKSSGEFSPYHIKHSYVGTSPWSESTLREQIEHKSITHTLSATQRGNFWRGNCCMSYWGMQ